MWTIEEKAQRSIGFNSLDEEVHVDSVPVTGAMPPWLTGTLVRVTPALMDGGGKTVKHWFDGAGMLNAFGFGDGSVSYGSRFLEPAAGQPAVGSAIEEAVHRQLRVAPRARHGLSRLGPGHAAE